MEKLKNLSDKIKCEIVKEEINWFKSLVKGHFKLITVQGHWKCHPHF